MPTPSIPASPPGRRAYLPIIDPKNPPPRLPRALMARLLLDLLGLQVSPRTLESWPLPTVMVNGRATLDTAETLAYGRKLLAAAPTLRGGRRRKGA